MIFEWHELKNRSNQAKHGVSFEEAVIAFSDPLGLDGPDVVHSSHEERFLRVVKTTPAMVLTIAYTVRFKNDGSKKIRIISVRKASRKERLAYEENS